MIEIQKPLKAYKNYPGPILLLAGPGTGKTYQMAMRIKYLIEELEANPDEIAVVTFTIEAARNLRERLTHDDINLVKEQHPKIISTMHSLGNSIITSVPKMFGLPEEFVVLTEKTPREVLLKDAANMAGFNRKKWKHAHNCRIKGKCNENLKSEKCKICRQYKKILRKCNRIDYDDQILLACKALRKDPELKEEWQKNTKYLLVDEYQDINEAQCEFIQLLTEGQTTGLFVVGDDDQSIYAFRGGSPKYIRNFEKYYGKKSKIGRLNKSWRCPEHILKGARAMVKKYNMKSEIKPKPTFSKKIKVNNKILIWDVPNDNKEAEIIARIAKKNIMTDSVTVIIPNLNYLPPIKRALKKAGLDYKYKFNINEGGLIRFPLLSNWVENPNDNLTMRYLLDLTINNHDKLTKKMKTSNQKITEKREAASKFIANLWGDVDKKKSLYEIICSEGAKSEKNTFLADLKDDLNDIYNLLKEKGSSRHQHHDFLYKTGLLLAPGKNPNGIISEIKEWMNELIESNRGSSLAPVKIYNMPSSKGLEGKIICVVGVSGGILPHPDDDIEEKSRLLYVAMTRAKKELHLFSARRRLGSVTFQKDSYQIKKSPYISAIPNKHVEMKYIRA